MHKTINGRPPVDCFEEDKLEENFCLLGKKRPLTHCSVQSLHRKHWPRGRERSH